MIDPREKLRFVELVEYNPEWPKLFANAASEIRSILKENCIDVYHIGSTAVPNIYAKPIIDVLPVVKDIGLLDSLNSKFEALGYVCMGEYGIPGRRFYWRSEAQRTHNVHLFEQNSPEINRHLAFKDYLIDHRAYAQAYSLIKRCLSAVFPNDIENYVNGKCSFVQMIDYKTGTARPKQLNAEDNIIIQPYNPAWPKLAEAEINTIKATVEQLPYVSIEHVGSTAVLDLSSKPIIDIFIAVQIIEEASQWVKPLEALGYVFWDENPDKAHLRFFKGMPPFGEKRTHHVHIVDARSHSMEHRILFRDILRSDNKIKHEYEALKLRLSQSHIDDREVYTDKKGSFIESVLQAHGYLKPITR